METQKKAEEKDSATDEEPDTAMETQTHLNSKSSSPWSFETNWTISHGSLNSSVTVESSDLPIIESDYYTTPKPPLLLLPPSDDESGPCQIKISFSQKHEIRQVYVRSTARTYEIHYASAPQSDDEYLCTVRCSMAAREEDLPHASNIEELVSADSERSTGEPAELKMVGGSNIGTNEDDWVEVKIPTAARSFKDFYEATAEISDVDPCTSITLRLLSLQSKGCVYVDEVYVFADPVESADSGHHVIQAENSAGTNLMAMLVPTLLQLSKSRVGGLEDKHASSSKEKEEHLEIDSRTSSTTNTASTCRAQQAEQSNMADWQHVKLHGSQLEKNVQLQEASGATPELNQFQIPVEAPERERSDSVSKNDHSYTRVERVLEHLVIRVSRIEDICLRFEENMLKPINSMVERLQRVEQQVEVLAKNSQSSGLPPGTRFSAPGFSSITSNSSSFYNEGNSSQPCGSSEFEKRGTTSTSSKSYSQLDDTSTSVYVPQFLPSLVVTAPEFSCCDDEEENDVLEPPKESPERKPKQALSIDEVLAAALAGFSSMTSVQSSLDTEAFTIRTSASEENGNDLPSECTEPPVAKLRSGVTDNDKTSKFTQIFKVTATEFTGEENDDEDKFNQPSHQIGKSIGTSGPCAIDEICASDSISTSTHDDAIESASRPIQDFANVHVEEASEMVDCPPAQKDDYNLTEITSELENSNTSSEISISDKTDILQLHVYQTSDGGSASTRDVQDRSDEEISADKPRPSYASIVDFEIPILEVKFTSRGILGAKSSLEALLTDETENSLEAPIQETDGLLISQEINLESAENGETTSSRAEDHLLVELDGYGEEKVSTDMAGEVIQDHLTYINQEAFVSLI